MSVCLYTQTISIIIVNIKQSGLAIIMSNDIHTNVCMYLLDESLFVRM